MINIYEEAMRQAAKCLDEIMELPRYGLKAKAEIATVSLAFVMYAKELREHGQ